MKRLVVGISGASGFQYGVKALQLLREHQVETHLVVSQGAEMTRALKRITPKKTFMLWRMSCILSVMSGQVLPADRF